MKITRRSLAAAVLAPAALAAQQQAKTPTPDEELSAAEHRLSSAFETLNKFHLEISVEPAFIFKAA